MPWSLNPQARPDLLLEIAPLTDGSGNYVSDWVDTTRATTVRVACYRSGMTGATFGIDEGMFDPGAGSPEVIRQQPVAASGAYAFAELPVTGRYVRLTLSGGIAETGFRATVRGMC